MIKIPSEICERLGLVGWSCYVSSTDKNALQTMIIESDKQIEIIDLSIVGTIQRRIPIRQFKAECLSCIS